MPAPTHPDPRTITNLDGHIADIYNQITIAFHHYLENHLRYWRGQSVSGGPSLDEILALEKHLSDCIGETKRR